MTPVDSTRVSWYLKLQQTLRFPSRSLAPFSKLRKLRNAEQASVDGEPTTTPRAQLAAMQPRLPRSETRSHSQTSSSKITRAPFNHLPARQVASQAAIPQYGRMSMRMVKSSQVASPARPRTINAASAAEVVKQPGFPLMKTPQSTQFHTMLDPAPQLKAGFAPVRSGSSVTGFAGRPPETSIRPAVLRRQLPSDQAKSTNFDADHYIASNFADRQEAVSTELGASELSDHQPQRAPSASTLHLDGAALGRWAIQHLTRTLGKPTTGMTGVDPRITPPRSRIQPF